MPLAAQTTLALSSLERGKALYERNCAVCHGKDGRADTQVARLLNPRPRVFADPVEMGRVSVDRMFRSIKEGRPGTAMSAWAEVLTETEIGDVIDYVHSLDTPRGTEPLSAERLSLEIGRRLYEKHCASCHGARGRADTEFARILNPKPRSFSDPIRMARLDDGRIYMAIFRGRPGTAMGGWGGLLSPAEINDVMRYVRTLAQPLPAGTTPAQLDVRAGEQIYQTYCVACHGDDGNGKTPLGQQLTPHPRDFTLATLMASKDDKQLAESVMRGMPGTSMSPWVGVLNKEDVRRVILFIRERFSAH